MQKIQEKTTVTGAPGKNSSLGTIGVIVILVAVISGFWYITNRNQNEVTSTEDTIVIESSEAVPPTTVVDNAMMEDAKIMNMVVDNSDSLVAKLSDVTGGTSSGTGYLLVKEGTIYHYVTADLPEPQEGTVYEGWLVGDVSAGEVTSTGVLNLNDTEMYTTSFMAEDATAYTKVIITIETVVDEKPEAHILSGVLE